MKYKVVMMSEQKFEEDKNIYAKLRHLRLARGLTVDDLASKIGEDSQKVGRIERGQRSLTVNYLLKVAKVLETPMEALLEESQKEKQQIQSEDSDVLNDVIIFVEQHFMNLLPISQDNLTEKARLISKLYSLVSRLPTDQQSLFLSLLTEWNHYLQERSQVINGSSK